jgi:hypothetical protein
MTDLQILNNVDHKDIRVINTPGVEYGDGLHSCPAYLFEFRDLQADFPILLQESSEGGFIPVAILGFESHENLFLEGREWLGLIKPAFLRRGPFLIGQHTVEDGEQVRLLSIDLAHPRVSRSEEGDALFQPLGGRTEYLEHIADLLETIHEGAEQTRRFTQCLAEWQLIESVTMDITLRDGSKNQLLGYSTVNEDAVRGLSGEQLATLASEGFLMPLFMMLGSMSNLRRLIDLKERRQLRTP